MLIALTSSDEPPPGGAIVDRKFLKGALISQYPASANDLQRKGAIEVFLFKVTEGPPGIERVAAFLCPDFKYL
jgi:hypothetical protein